MEYHISTHLHLIPLDIKHATALLEAVDSRRKSLQTYLPWVSGVTDSCGAKAYILDRTQTLYANYFAIMRQNQFIGVFAVKPAKAIQTYEIGYWLSEAGRGKAVISQILKVMLPHLKKVHQTRYVEFHCLEFHCLEFNNGSIKIAQWVGAKFIGHYSMIMKQDMPSVVMCLYRARL
ncbi:GNAT family N-acetyltransferase [Pseudoalteromonas sp. OOF1S-7]|uniref:GNAT family N-acetyltransferase n=1 Tax=Pseudoalteromonas sp. OOF1S-7 TaxID=2917757 RepID=UPI001EF562E7|nr:GNAT family N-acetyltransferase [Pseudoalteromonas sp. OOF1S-7]MCG7534891.1 GNAT family N-acetyltransferase [Pseudoalteromonas sp. OOF1S-7]